MAQQNPVPTANMICTGSRYSAPSASVERADEDDAWVTATVEKANSKRDREDDDYTDETRKSGSLSTPVKRQRQAVAKASGGASSPRSRLPRAVDESEESTKAQRINAIARINAIWGFNLETWPVCEFSPLRAQKDGQQGRESRRKAKPQDWDLRLLNELLHLAQHTAEDQHRRIAEVLGDVIQDRAGDSSTHSTMLPQDIQRTSQILVQEQSETGPSRRSPTLAAAANSIEATGDDGIPSHHDAERRDSPMVAEESANVPETAQVADFSYRHLNDSVFMETLIEKFIDKTSQFCGQCIEAIREVQKEKEQHEVVLLEKAQRWRTNFTFRG